MLLRDSNTKLRYTGLNQLWVTVQMIEQREKSVSAFVSFLLQPPPSPSFVILRFFLHQHTLFSSSSHTHYSSTMPAPAPSLHFNIFTSPLTNPPFPSPSPPRDQGWVTAVTARTPPPQHTHRQMHAQTSRETHTHTPSPFVIPHILTLSAWGEITVRCLREHKQ